jgi:hypothetical protein
MSWRCCGRRHNPRGIDDARIDPYTYLCGFSAQRQIFKTYLIEIIGRSGEIRTPDPLLPKQVGSRLAKFPRNSYRSVEISWVSQNDMQTFLFPPSQRGNAERVDTTLERVFDAGTDARDAFRRPLPNLRARTTGRKGSPAGPPMKLIGLLLRRPRPMEPIPNEREDEAHHAANKERDDH